MRTLHRLTFGVLPLLLATGCAVDHSTDETDEDRAVARQPTKQAPSNMAHDLRCDTTFHTAAAGISDLSYRWPGAIVPYYLETSGGGALVAQEVTNFHQAVAEIEMRVPVRFKEYSTAEFQALPGSADVLYVWNDPNANSGQSKVGHLGGTQDLRLGSAGNGGMGVRVILHELGHTLGLRHETQRADRGNFLNVCGGNSSDSSQYAIRTDVDFLAPYDLHSIMHYFQDEFLGASPDPTQCGGHTMVLLNPSANTFPFMPNACTVCPTTSPTCNLDCHNIGWGTDYSAEDINTLTLMYGRPLQFAQSGELYATALAVADLDKDGYDDVIVGVPGANGGQGEVFAYKGTLRGISPWKILLNKPAPGDDFGRALAVGDFNHDGFSDVAVGAPKRALDGQPRSGTVTVYYGGSFHGARFTPDCATNPTCQGGGFPDITARFGLSPKDAAGVANQDGDLFGSALAVADFDGDGFDDLAVGAPGKSGNQGRVFVYSGKAIETSTTPAVMLGGAAKGAFGNFGSALATGDLNGDKVPDLAVGAPGAGPGHVSVFQAVSITNFLERVVVNAPATVQTGERFGAALVTARLAGPTRPAELAVGAPLVRLGAGQVDIFNFSGTFFSNFIQQQDAGTFRGGYGSALATLDLDSDGTDDLAVGAPNFSSPQEGIVELLKGSAGHVTHWNQILSPNGPIQANFGASFAVGRVGGDGIGIPPNVVTEPARLLVGAPATPFFTSPGAGRFYGYIVKTGTILQRQNVGAEMMSPFAKL